MSKEVKKYKLTEKEKRDFRKLCGEATALYNLMDEEGLGPDWKHDTERFMAFTAAHTKNLIKHSINLTRLTLALIVLTGVHLFLILNMTYKWVEI